MRILNVRITRTTDIEEGKKTHFRKRARSCWWIIRIYVYYVYVYAYTGVGLNGPCVGGMHPKSRVGLPTRVVRASVSGTRFIRNDFNIILFTVE